MKNLFKKTGKLFLTLLVLLNSAFQITPVFAEENDPIDYSEAVETITELGPAEEVFPEIYAEETENPKLRLTPGFGSDRIVRINGVGVYGYDYIRILTVGGNVVYNSSSYRGEPIKLGKSGMYIERCNKYCFKILIK